MLTLNRDDELRNDGKNLVATVVEHVHDALLGEESIWVLGLAEAVEEHRQVVVEVQFLDLNFPCNLVALGVKLNADREVAALVVLPERAWLRLAHGN